MVGATLDVGPWWYHPHVSGDDRGMNGYRVIRESGISMTSPEGSSMLAGLFGGAVGPDDVEVFPFELASASVSSSALVT